ncbi:MAG: CaiB/BaiF CoA transferase family protein [Alphaproteobacteria bacterium]
MTDRPLPPLHGIRVADFSRVIAGPLCAMTLADLGADVVKIENPDGGDDTRGYRPPDYKGLSPAFLCYNRNKRSIALDLNKAEDLAKAKALTERADLVIENFRTGLMEKYGLGYEDLAPSNPRLVYLTVSAYGRTGPFKARAGYDPVVQAESGFMSMTGDPDLPPLRTGVPMIDVTTGMTTVQAAIAALIARETTGRGQYVEVPLFDTGFAMTLHASQSYLLDGVCPQRAGNGSILASPIGVFHGADGPFFLTIGGERPWRRLAGELLNRPDLLNDPRFATNAARVANDAELCALLNAIFATQPRQHWIDTMRAAGVPVGAIRTIPEAYTSAEAKTRGIVGRIPHETLGDVPNVRSPLRLYGTPLGEAVGAPELNQHGPAIEKEWLASPVPAAPAAKSVRDIPHPLSGLKVLDFTRVIAGPHCAMTLGDLGADVVKIEHPETGDDARGYAGPRTGGEGAFYLAYNRNKRSLALDLSKPEGQALARELAAEADVVLENFSAGVMTKFGLDYESLKAINPSIVYCAMSGYGRDGDFARRAGYDPVAQAESGFMSITGRADGEPTRTGIPMIDVTTGLGAAQATLAALFHRRRTGEGQYVDVALFDTACAMSFHFGMAYLIDGRTPMRGGNGSPAANPVGVYEASDGPFQMTLAGERVWKKFIIDVVNRPDIAADAHFLTNSARVANRERVDATLNEIFATDTRENWVARMRAAGAPAGPIRTIAEACESPEVKERERFVTVPHPTAGSVPCLRSPIRLDGTPVRPPFAAPTLGQHTAAALGDWLGYDEARIDALKAQGIVK